MARDVVNKIRLEFGKERIRTSVSICKGDTLSRVICITLLNEGAVYEIPENAIATLLATKPDGKTVYNDCSISGNEIGYTVTNQLISTVGDVECQVKITTSDGGEVTSPVFLIRVYERLFDESIVESSNDYQALQVYCLRAQEACAKTEARLEEMIQIKKAFMSEYQEKVSALEETAHKIYADNERQVKLDGSWDTLTMFPLDIEKKYLIFAKISKEIAGNGSADVLGVRIVAMGNTSEKYTLAENAMISRNVYEDSDFDFDDEWCCAVSGMAVDVSTLMIDGISTNAGSGTVSVKILELR